jgi:hypothetical protein
VSERRIEFDLNANGLGKSERRTTMADDNRTSNRSTILETPTDVTDIKTVTPSVSDGSNPDPLTGETGAHPVGTGVGAAGGAATGAAIGGAVGGPVGALLGAAIGGVAGGLAGKGVAEAVNPTEEDAYWRSNYSNRPYAQGRNYDQLRPAYEYGWNSRAEHHGRHWNEAENDLQAGWDKTKAKADLGWHEAKGAASIRGSAARRATTTGARTSPPAPTPRAVTTRTTSRPTTMARRPTTVTPAGAMTTSRTIFRAAGSGPRASRSSAGRKPRKPSRTPGIGSPASPPPATRN